MRAIEMRHHLLRSCLFYCSLLLFLAPFLSFTLDLALAQSVNKQALRAAAIASQKANGVSEEYALTTFDEFTAKWMEKLAKNEEFRRTKQVKIIPYADGFLAEYRGYAPQRRIKVRKTTSAETPYIGTLHYNERIMRCAGKTRAEALNGPFSEAGTSSVAEIFRFTKGEWHY
jgi:hypothetical protein